MEPRPIIRSNKPVLAESPERDSYISNGDTQWPSVGRNSTFEGPTQLRQDPFNNNQRQPAPVRTTSENLSARISHLRPVSRVPSDPYVDHTETYSHASNGYDGWHRDRSVSPTPSYGGDSGYYSRTSPGPYNGASIAKKGPPPPPPSRAKKPPPPAPPIKRPILAGDA